MQDEQTDKGNHEANLMSAFLSLSRIWVGTRTRILCVRPQRLLPCLRRASGGHCSVLVKLRDALESALSISERLSKLFMPTPPVENRVKTKPLPCLKMSFVERCEL